MSRFAVKFTPRAESDVEKAYAWEKNVSQRRADIWKSGLASAIDSFRSMPSSCPVAEEYSEPDRVVRRKIFGSGRGVYRMYFRIHADAVE